MREPDSIVDRGKGLGSRPMGAQYSRFTSDVSAVRLNDHESLSVT